MNDIEKDLFRLGNMTKEFIKAEQWGRVNTLANCAIALRSQLTREQNEPLTCEGCIYDGFSKSGRYLLGEENPCFGCRRNSFTSDAYRNKHK